MSRNVKLAAVFDALADHLDAVDAEKTSSARSERQSKIDDLASKYAAATGEELPPEVRSKLAESDETIVALLRGLAEKQAGTVEPLGGPSTRSDEPVSMTKKEAADAAHEKFGNWLTS